MTVVTIPESEGAIYYMAESTTPPEGPTLFEMVEAGEHLVGDGNTRVQVKVYTKPGYTLPEGLRLHPESADEDGIGEYYLADSRDYRYDFTWTDHIAPVTPEAPTRDGTTVLLPDSDQAEYVLSIDGVPSEITSPGEHEVGEVGVNVRVYPKPGFSLLPENMLTFDEDLGLWYLLYLSLNSEQNLHLSDPNLT